MEASTSIVSENFPILSWKLPIISMEVNLLPSTIMEEVNRLPASMEVDRMEAGGSFGSLVEAA